MGEQRESIPGEAMIHFLFVRVPAERKENSCKPSAEPSLLELCRGAAEFAEMQSICEHLELYKVKVNPELTKKKLLLAIELFNLL